ncbi:MAG: SPFH domain-containing protein [Thermomicrobiales bacterium]
MAILDLIEYPDSRANEIVHRIPEYGSGEFRLGSQCVVRESQRAVFSRDGKALDVLGPGRHTLSTANIPILSDLIGIPFGGKSPFRAEVFFVNVREFTDLKWGTVQPIVYRDTDFGMVRLRAFGTYSMRVSDVQLFVNQVVGTRATYLVEDIEEFLRSIILTEFNDMVGETMTSILDLPLLTQEIASAARHALTDDFERLGIELQSFQIMSVTPPEEVQKRIDERSGMAALGDMNQYLQYQTAQAIREMPSAGGGSGGGTISEGAGLGAGLGMGAAMGQVISQAISGGGGQQSQQNPPAQAGAAASAGATKFCTNCGHQMPASAKFCPNCGTAASPAGNVCPNCGSENPPGAKFCTECGTGLQG